ncbi:glycosyltransferase [Geobacter sulfurreducens]|uniref:glycosyltransferase n=1 Tax=Geobacter sulfurreducens TaxID=35554 RepID=UPI0020B85B41|nr:glycosyltransferase [Geobacter sulfurreducens]UTG91612.1 hypothetical protein J8622_11295 [Geobacter sulfurreducens]
MKMLAISYFANETGMACSHHLDDRLPLLADSGVEITLLTSIISRKNKKIRQIFAPSIFASGLRFEIRSLLKRKNYKKWKYRLLETILTFPLLPFYYIEKMLFNIDTTWSWSFGAAFVGYLNCVRHSPTVIYSTGGPISAHVAAGLISRWTGIPWIAEFQDPLIHSYCARSNFELKLTLWAERFICKHASRVVFLTRKAVDAASARTELGARGLVIYPGAKRETLNVSYEATGYLRFAHLGSLGGVRNLGYFLRGLECLIQELPLLREQIRVELYGGVGKDVRQQINDFLYKDMIRENGMIPREKCLEIMRKTDVLLLIQGADDVSKETIPSKAYEYLHAQRPILALVYGNEELKRMLKDLGHIPVDASNEYEIRDGIMAFVEKYNLGLMQENADQSPYTTEMAVQQLMDVVLTVTQ